MSSSPAGTQPKSPAQKALKALGLVRDMDLCLHLPLRYEDETQLSQLREGRHGEMLQFEAVVQACEVQYRGRRQLVVRVDDGQDTCTLRFFHFSSSTLKALAVGVRLRFRGELQRSLLTGMTMLHPSFRSVDTALPATLSPVYPSTAQLPQGYLRKAIGNALDKALHAHTLAETLWHSHTPSPQPPLGPQELPTLAQALTSLHRPDSPGAAHALADKTHPAWQRLIAEELLAQQLSQTQARIARAREHAPPCGPQESAQDALEKTLLDSLPFCLTRAQERAIAEIFQDLGKSQPMHRLLQGDVGSGKTLVAAMAAARVVAAGYQCALMVPTEILATQHFSKLVAWLSPLLQKRGKTVAWLWGAQKGAHRRAMLADIEQGRAALAIGTHALMQRQVRFAQLALTIIDEQHRFGVAQRLALREKTCAQESTSHLLMMSATPIPRTLAMSYLADLDISTLDELPAGRLPIVTKLVRATRRTALISRIEAQLALGQQVYWVCPMIEQSETLDLANATRTHAQLQTLLPTRRVALLHARLPYPEKQAIMDAFVTGHTHVLVSTTVVEVGVDVANATLMVIEHAERFGLAQLHQLRGRVGRGHAASVCVLLYDPGEGAQLGLAAKERLKAMVETTDGFEIARRDLRIRGPGDFLGARQSGLQVLRFASPTERAVDAAWLEWARATAPTLLRLAPLQAQAHIHRWQPQGTAYLSA